MYTVLIIEDNDTMREGMKHVLSKLALNVRDYAASVEAVRSFKEKKDDIVITDYRMDEMDGIQVLDEIRRTNPRTQVMMITAYGSIELAVEAMKLGAADFIAKPFSHQEFQIRVEKLCDKLDREDKISRLADENLYLREELEGEYNFGEIIGQSAEMKRIYKTIAKVAKTDSTVMVYGKSGTGKELVARAIYKAGPRAEKAFIRVNCGALAEGVLESELFGHEKGAFTHAIRLKKGRFELADGGTLFLDEVGDLPPALQVKLLRVLQEKEFERVGGEETLRTNVRVIAATNRDLEKLVEQGDFREDLFYRLHIIPVYLPPLQDRTGDIPLLIRFFLDRLGKKIGNPDLTLTRSALDVLCSYHWPGNVRELENILERAAVLSEESCIDVSDLPVGPSKFSSQPESGLNEILAHVEKEAIEQALRKAGGVKTKAAQLLKIKTSALYYKLEKYDLL